MQFVERYPEITARFDRFWEGAETDRPILYLTCPKDNPDTSVAPATWERPEDRVLPEVMVADARYQLARTAYYGDAHPRCFINFGPGILHGCIGGELDLTHPETTWFPLFLSDVAEFTSLRFDPGCKWWERILASTGAVLEAVGDEALVAVTDIGGCGDIVASAVGRDILMDIAERPQVVRAAVDHCHQLFLEAYEYNYQFIHAHQDVSTSWWPFIARGRTDMTQCDINALISPQAFEEIFLGDLAGIFTTLDYATYHLDGIGTEVHMPALVEKPGLRCIQWVPAPGTSALDHTEMLQGIQEAGVNITFACRLEDLERACKSFDKRRLMLVLYCQNERQAKETVENVLRWSEKSGPPFVRRGLLPPPHVSQGGLPKVPSRERGGEKKVGLDV